MGNYVCNAAFCISRNVVGFRRKSVAFKLSEYMVRPLQNYLFKVRFVLQPYKLEKDNGSVNKYIYI